jgi:hypothetical protein
MIGWPTLVIPVLGAVVSLYKGSNVAKISWVIWSLALISGWYFFNQWRYNMIAINIVTIMAVWNLCDYLKSRLAILGLMFVLLITCFYHIKYIPFKAFPLQKGLIYGLKFSESHIAKREIRQLQAQVDEGVKVVALLDLPRYLDFKRNNIFLIDYPYLSNLKGSEQDLKSWFDELNSQNIEYLFYSQGLIDMFKRYFSIDLSTKTSYQLSRPLQFELDLKEYNVFNEASLFCLNGRHVISIPLVLELIESRR